MNNKILPKIFIVLLILLFIFGGYVIYDYFKEPAGNAVVENKEKDIFNPFILGWNEVSIEAPWQKRDSHTIYEFNGKLFMLGGLDGTEGVYAYHKVAYENVPHFNDIWQLDDGVNWIKLKDEAAFPKIRSTSVIDINGKLYMYGGWSPEALYDIGIWESLDGVEWKKIKNKPEYGEREGQKVLKYKDRLLLVGGVNYAASQTFNDIWESVDGVTWRKIADGPWEKRWDHDIAELNGSLWFSSGMNLDNGGYSDVWTSDDAINWKLVSTTTPWGKRQGHSLLSYKGFLWLIGGLNTSTDEGRGDTWFSADGVNWKRMAFEGEWTGREDHVAYIFNDKMFFNGGMGEDWKWYEDTWVLEDAPCGGELSSKVSALNSNFITSDAWGLYCLPDSTATSTDPFFLAGDNPNEIAGIASVTKLMTAVTLHTYNAENTPISITDEVIQGGSLNRYKVGEDVPLNELRQSMLIESDNDATRAIVNYLGASEFIKKMNDLARQIGMRYSSFKNPTGLDQGGSAGNFSTVSDLARLVNYISKDLKLEYFIFKVGLNREKNINNIEGGIHHLATSTNALLNDPEVSSFIIGAKTGETPEAKKNLVTLFKDQKGNNYISIVLGSEDHLGETKKIMKVVVGK